MDSDSLMQSLLKRSLLLLSLLSSISLWWQQYSTATKLSALDSSVCLKSFPPPPPSLLPFAVSLAPFASWWVLQGIKRLKDTSLLYFLLCGGGGTGGVDHGCRSLYCPGDFALSWHHTSWSWRWHSLLPHSPMRHTNRDQSKRST